MKLMREAFDWVMLANVVMLLVLHISHLIGHA